MYSPKSIEPKWQKFWLENQTFAAENPPFSGKVPEKAYVLDMFPYPSGVGLHVGHPKGYIATDVYSRFLKTKGYNVLHPMGWDAFGLPAENYAVKTGTHPRITTAKNIDRYREQLQLIGLAYDWAREIDTTDPKYYKWTQWIFTKLVERWLAYEADMPVNWCPGLKAVLANEEIVNGKSEVGGHPVERRNMRQWVLRITKYAEELLADVDALDWPEGIKEQQRNWIGKSEGCEFKLLKSDDSKKFLSAYTTRIDTVYGMGWVIIAPDHPNVSDYVTPDHERECSAYISASAAKSDQDRLNEGKEKTGVFTGSFVINPFNGEKVPVWIGDYVLGSYGTGAVMGVAAHDDRDFELAQKYHLKIQPVVQPPENVKTEGTYTDKTEGTLINSGEFDGLSLDEAREKMTQKAEKDSFGSRKVNYKLRDWIFSRQRYWGEPMPIIHLNREDLNGLVRLEFHEEADKEIFDRIMFGKKTLEIRAGDPSRPERETVKQGDCLVMDDLVNSRSILVKIKKIHRFDSLKELYENKTAFVMLGKEYDSFEDFVALYDSFSSDYLNRMEKHGILGYEIEVVSEIYPGLDGPYILDKNLPLELPEVERYEPSDDGRSPLANITEWVNIDIAPNLRGKRETNTMPQWAWSCWYYLRFMDPHNEHAIASEEALNYWQNVDCYVGGAEHAVLHLLYARFWHKVLFDIGVVPTKEPFHRLMSPGLILGADGEKMSKSRGNVVNPDSVIEVHGVDTFRLYEMSMADFRDPAPWNTDAINGCRRFLDRAEALFAEKPRLAADEMKSMKLLHKTIKKVSEDIESYKFNTAISALIILVNEGVPTDLELQAEWKSAFVRLLHPFAPHLAEELWQRIGNAHSVYLSQWPEFNMFMTIDDEVTIAVQVNGKLRGTFQFLNGVAQEEVSTTAYASPDIQKWTDGKTVVREIFVPNKLLNIVVKD